MPLSPGSRRRSEDEAFQRPEPHGARRRPRRWADRPPEGGIRPWPLRPSALRVLLARCPSVRDGRLALRPYHPSARKLGDFDQAIAHYRAAAERTLSIPEQKLSDGNGRAARRGAPSPRRIITRSPARADSARAPGIPDSRGGSAPEGALRASCWSPSTPWYAASVPGSRRRTQLLLERRRPALAGPDAQRLLHRQDKYLPVADLTGAGSVLDRLGDRGGPVVGHEDLELYLGEEFDHVLRA